jgi:SOS-response transcriptional repressor LexA
MRYNQSMHWYRPNFDPIQRPGHKQGRFATVINPEGILIYADGAQIDLHRELTFDKATVLIMPIISNAMQESGLYRGGMMTVDRGLKPFKGCIVVVRYNDQIVTRRLEKSVTRWVLVADDQNEQTLYLDSQADYSLVGVVTNAIKSTI